MEREAKVPRAADGTTGIGYAKPAMEVVRIAEECINILASVIG